MRRRLWISLVLTVLVVGGALGANLFTGNTPILGIDLAGGVSVILAPTEEASEDDLLIIRDLVRDELEQRGIAEPDVRVQGETIVVDLPGVDDQQEAIDAVQVSGVVQLRPVLAPGACPESTTPLVVTDDEPEPVDGVSVDEEPQGLMRPLAAPDDDPVSTDGALGDLSQVQLDNQPELLPSRDGLLLCVGPDQNVDGVIVFARGGASAVFGQQGWEVVAELRDDGEAFWNQLALQCNQAQPTCPTRQLAIVLDDVVQSAPTVNVPVFEDQVSITGQFTEEEARSLAQVLNRGAFPVQVEAEEARTVSASAGGDSLRAAVIAGLIGVAFVLLFLLAYYRWFALVILGGLTIWGALVYSVATFVSDATNYALSLAGITGIIVAVGVTVDSYVVFFERMKDEIRNGRTMKNAAPRSFKATWRTILSADLVSVIGAAILFWLSVGSVRGFALYLGITTLCDLVVCYFFTRPAVILLARSKFMEDKKAFGLEVAPA